MWPDSPFAHPIGSFKHPVPLVAVDPDDNPDVTVCFRREWLPYIIGALQQLLLQSTWKTSDPNALNRAQGQAQLLVSMFIQGCPEVPLLDIGGGTILEDALSSQIRISPDDTCIIQMWCIDHWEDWYNPKVCVPGAVTQPQPGGVLPSGGCKTYNVTLQGNGQWLLPVPVSQGDTIQISNAVGGWADGTSNWSCPSGQHYTLGICGPMNSGGAGLPIPTLAHMRLIAKIDTAFYDAYNATLSPLAGATDVQVTFQANDDPLTDNAGSIQFDVTVCKQSTALTIAYNLGLGVGPATANVGDIISIASVFYAPSGRYVAYPQFSKPVKVQVVGVTGYTADPASNATYWTWLPTGGTLESCNALQPCDGSNPVGFAPAYNINEYQLISATSMSLLLKIVEIN